jgi:3-deoxy-manno-octulosonate cytidylyltransferase (CMP-KDO synthetase)
VIIATDDERIAEAAADWGAEISMTSASHVSGTERVAEVVRRMQDVEIAINVQGDEPLVDPKLIDAFAQKLRRDPGIEMITAAHPFENAADAASPHQVKVVLGRKSDAIYFSRAQIPFPRNGTPNYLRHQGIYGFRRNALLQLVRAKPTPLERAESLEQLRALEIGVRIHVLVTKTGSPGIDTPEDAAALAKNLACAGRKERR